MPNIPEPAPESQTLTLKEPYKTGHIELVEWVRTTLGPTAIVVSGTIIRGTPSPTSDFDVVVIHDEPWRQRIQRWFNGVPAELFVNPPYQLRAEMASEAVEGGPIMAHMLATGIAIWDPTGIAATLQGEARSYLDAGPDLPRDILRLHQYGIATQFEDAVDLVDIDPDRSRSLLVQSLIEAIQWHFHNQGRWLPRPKALLTDLDALEPELGASVRAVLREPDVPRQAALATRVIQDILGHTGFFPWEGERQPRPFPQDVNHAAQESPSP